MKYLIISDAASMHIYNFIKNVLLEKGYDIYILRHSIHNIPEQYETFYRENNIKVFTADRPNTGKNKLKTAKRFLRKIRFMLSLGKIDVCHIHYLHRSSLLLYRLFRHNIGKLILSYWGTDILKPTQKEISAQKKCLPHSDAITVTVEHSKDVFIERFGHGYDNKLSVTHFPNGVLHLIREYAKTVTKEECRKRANIPDGKLCVVCGYNSDPDQMIDVVVREIAKLSPELKEKIHLILPMQYGLRNAAYEQSVYDALSCVGVSYEVLTDYVPFEKNAELCLATDIYIHVRKSDAFSNAMKEQIYAGSCMIQGEWLIYKELEMLKADYIKVKSLDEIHERLETLLRERTFRDDIYLFEPL